MSENPFPPIPVHKPLKCSRQNCAAEATHTPKICVPGMGGPAKEENCITGIMGLPVCESHFIAMKAADFLQTEKQRAVYRILAGERAQPDFKRAFLVKLLLTSGEYLTFQKEQNHA